MDSEGLNSSDSYTLLINQFRWSLSTLDRRA